jgi:hypothetical protein
MLFQNRKPIFAYNSLDIRPSEFILNTLEICFEIGKKIINRQSVKRQNKLLLNFKF